MTGVPSLSNSPSGLAYHAGFHSLHSNKSPIEYQSKVGLKIGIYWVAITAKKEKIIQNDIKKQKSYSKSKGDLLE